MRIDREAELRAELRERGGRRVEREQRSAFGPEHGVLDNGQRLGERPVLLHDAHAGPARDDAGPRIETALRAAEVERARIGREDAGDDLHERRLARTVLADKRVHRSAPHGELRAAQHRTPWIRLYE